MTAHKKAALSDPEKVDSTATLSPYKGNNA
jgi:hypothetical protein